MLSKRRFLSSFFSGKRAMIITAIGAIASHTSQYFHWGKSIVDWLQRYDFFADPSSPSAQFLRKLFSPSVGQFLFILFLAGFFIAVIRYVSRAENKTKIAASPSDETQSSRDSQKESKPNEKMNALIREDVRNLPEVPCGEGWLHAIAEHDRLNIQNAVVVSNINFYNYASDTHHPYLEFVFTIFNKSVYEISIDDSIDGYITLNREKLKKDNLELEKNSVQNCHVRGTASFTLYQYLNDADLNRFMNSTEDREFWFNNVILKIKGGDNYPQVVSQQLKMDGQVSKKYPVWHDAHNIRIEELSARIKELEEEKAARQKPLIRGEIKAVYYEWWLKSSEDESKSILDDHHFAINIYLANRGAVTTIERFKLVLKVGEHSYNGEREKAAHDVKEGEENWRKWGQKELGDIETLNDEPLNHTRNGWLWFAVMGVPHTKDRAEMELELYVIDKDGTSYELETLPQSQWANNPFRHQAFVEAQRAKMKNLI